MLRNRAAQLARMLQRSVQAPGEIDCVGALLQQQQRHLWPSTQFQSPIAQLVCWQLAQVHLQPSSAAFHTVAAARQQQQRQQGSQSQELQAQQQEFDAITDQIPIRPVSAVEGASYSVLIFAGLALAGAVLWATVNELLIQPREYTCFNLALEKLRDDPRVTVRLGTPISGYGADSRNRAARQRIAHRDYTDAAGVEHIQVQFHARGPSGKARVTADMYQDGSKQWQYSFLFVDVDAPVPQRVILVGPQYAQ